MVEHELDKVFGAIVRLRNIVEQLNQRATPYEQVPPVASQAILDELPSIFDFAVKMDFKVAIGRLGTLKTGLEGGATCHNASQHLQNLMSELYWDLDGFKFLSLSSAESSLYASSPDELFGTNFCTRFPSVADEISEAAKCLGLQRGTASVFHLTRILEAAAKGIWESLVLCGLGSAKSAPAKGWGEWSAWASECIAQVKWGTIGPPNADKESFYLDVNATMRAVYKAWRCPTSHFEKTYTMERATQIYDACRHLSQVVAEHLDESGAYY